MQINKVPRRGSLRSCPTSPRCTEPPLWRREHCCLCDAPQLLHSLEEAAMALCPLRLTLSPPVHTPVWKIFTISQRFRFDGFCLRFIQTGKRIIDLDLLFIQNSQYRMQRARFSRHSGKRRRSLTEAETDWLETETSDKVNCVRKSNLYCRRMKYITHEDAKWGEVSLSGALITRFIPASFYLPHLQLTAFSFWKMPHK